ncbi:hypothetical protein BBJ28_00013668 [Nothophytophthora sp. Chile5]|nr:hypothetical protein BBJ28_00013668 [Nothophytophthora sp. Chile5]
MTDPRDLHLPRSRHYGDHQGVDDLASFFARRFVAAEEQNELLRREVSRLRQRTFELQQLMEERSRRIQELVANIRQLILQRRSERVEVSDEDAQTGREAVDDSNEQLGEIDGSQSESFSSSTDNGGSSGSSSAYLEGWSDVEEAPDIPQRLPEGAASVLSTSRANVDNSSVEDGANQD